MLKDLCYCSEDIQFSRLKIKTEFMFKFFGPKL